MSEIHRDDHEHPDYSVLPQPLDLSTLVELHEVDPVVHEPASHWATPELEGMARTYAIGAF